MIWCSRRQRSAAEAPHHAVGRGGGQRGKAEPGRCADDQIDAVGDFVHGLAEIEALVGKKQRQVRGDVAKGPYTEHAADVDQIAVAKNTPERRHRQRHAEKDQRPESGAMDQIVERPRAMRDRIGFEQRLGERQQQDRKRRDAQRRQPPAPVTPKLPGEPPSTPSLHA